MRQKTTSSRLSREPRVRAPVAELGGALQRASVEIKAEAEAEADARPALHSPGVGGLYMVVDGALKRVVTLKTQEKDF
jgi:hypothetical protein